MRKTIGIVLALILLLTVIPSAAASESNQPTPRYTYIASLASSLSIDNLTKVATCGGDVVAWSYLPVKVVCKLQIYQGGQWITLKTWTSSGNGTAAISETYNVEYGNDYRVHVTGYVYDENGNILESASGTHAQYCPWPTRSLD